ncbi:hypothetical protein ERJ75_000433000 [Trypanosoma vivax]|nr:hypothetical protein ERJ75_000433000 [Trypanosoma vivax]
MGLSSEGCGHAEGVLLVGQHIIFAPTCSESFLLFPLHSPSVPPQQHRARSVPDGAYMWSCACDGFCATLKATSAGDDKGLVWPYSVKHQLLPAHSGIPLPEHQLEGNPAPSATTRSASKRNATENGQGSSESNGLLRYPTPSSAVAMLSDQFRQRVTLFRQKCACLNASAFPAEEGVPAGGGGALTFLGTGSAIPSKYRKLVVPTWRLCIEEVPPMQCTVLWLCSTLAKAVRGSWRCFRLWQG